MSVYHVYTITNSKEILCLFKCEKCGEINLNKVKIYGQAQYNDKSTGFRKATVEAKMAERNQNASSQAADQLEDKIANLELNLSMKALNEANLSCKCGKCGKEPWWTMKIMRILMKWASILSVITVILLLMVGRLDVYAVYLPLAATALCWGGYLVCRKINSKWMESKELPIFADNIEKLREKKNQFITYQSVSI